uniref:Uncharacterized protein n=1 Tax=Cacopsylla melanoneura TaxID=428564 RepID=A0A8D9F1L5_9HEMI
MRIHPCPSLLLHHRIRIHPWPSLLRIHPCLLFFRLTTLFRTFPRRRGNCRRSRKCRARCRNDRSLVFGRNSYTGPPRCCRRSSPRVFHSQNIFPETSSVFRRIRRILHHDGNYSICLADLLRRRTCD